MEQNYIFLRQQLYYIPVFLFYLKFLCCSHNVYCKMKKINKWGEAETSFKDSSQDVRVQEITSEMKSRIETPE